MGGGGGKARGEQRTCLLKRMALLSAVTLRMSLPMMSGEAEIAQIAICVLSSSSETHGAPALVSPPMSSMSMSCQWPPYGPSGPAHGWSAAP